MQDKPNIARTFTFNTIQFYGFSFLMNKIMNKTFTEPLIAVLDKLDLNRTFTKLIMVPSNIDLFL